VTGVLPPPDEAWRRPRRGQGRSPAGGLRPALTAAAGDAGPHRSGNTPQEHKPGSSTGTDGQQREGLNRRFDCEPRRSPTRVHRVTLDLRHAEAPQPNAVLR